MRQISPTLHGDITAPAQGISLPSVTVVICAYTEKRWDALKAAISSLQHQPVSMEVVVVIDHHPELLRRVVETFPEVIAVSNDGPPGLSGARNSGVAIATGEIIAFLDDDAVADRAWLQHLLTPFADPRIVGAGGAVQADWETTQPRWFPEEFYWVVGCSYRGMPETGGEVRNPIGANMAFRREVFTRIGDFHSDVGRTGTSLAGCEETEFCIRLRQRLPDTAIVYVPQAVVRHRVPSGRSSWRYFRSRCYAEGRSKATVSHLVGATDGLASERTYTLKVLPAGAFRAIGYGFSHGDAGSIARALAIGLGLTWTSVGYMQGRLSARGTKSTTFQSSPITHSISGH